jgi:DNA-binding NarL/FixJ family response regulator
MIREVTEVTMDGKIGVQILCNNRLAREAIARILSKKHDLRVIGAQAITATSIDEVLSSEPDVLVLDSLQLLLENSNSSPHLCGFTRSVKCVLVAMEDDEKTFFTAVRRGVLGYVLQEAAAADVVAAIRTVARGEAVCPPQYTRGLFKCLASLTGDLPNSRRRARMGLTNREQQLLPLIARGMTNKEIAVQLHLSEQTVKNHVHRILRKTGVGDRLSVLEACQTRTLAS